MSDDELLALFLRWRWVAIVALVAALIGAAYTAGPLPSM